MTSTPESRVLQWHLNLSYIRLAECLSVCVRMYSPPAFIACSAVLLCRTVHFSVTCPSSSDHPRSLHCSISEQDMVSSAIHPRSPRTHINLPSLLRLLLRLPLFLLRLFPRLLKKLLVIPTHILFALSFPLFSILCLWHRFMEGGSVWIWIWTWR